MYCEGHTCLEDSIMKQNYFPPFNLKTISKQDFCVSEKYPIFLRCIKKSVHSVHLEKKSLSQKGQKRHQRVSF